MALSLATVALAALLAFAVAGCGGLDAEHSLTIEIDTTDLGAAREGVQRFEVVTGWLGRDQRVPLRDDGVAPDRVSGDRRFTGQIAGGAVQLLRLRLSVFRSGAADTVIGDRMVRLVEPQMRLYYSASPAEGRGGMTLERVPGPGGASGQARAELLRWGLGVGWIGLCGLWLRALVRRAGTMASDGSA